jgi:hypothetical protein
MTMHTWLIMRFYDCNGGYFTDVSNYNITFYLLVYYKIVNMLYLFIICPTMAILLTYILKECDHCGESNRKSLFQGSWNVLYYLQTSSRKAIKR